MTIYTDLPIRRGPFALEDYQSSLGASLDATASEALTFNPIPSIMRRRELARAERGVGNDILDYNPFGDQPTDTASAMTDAASARQKIKDAGLDLTVPDDGIRARALDILIERKQEERQRQDILNRAPGGFEAGALRFGTNIAVQALDPLNIASAFIPVVGEARYGAMLGRAGGALGRAGVRAGVGALEGAVGAATVEPIIYSAATAEQADYGLADSIANVAFGTVLGGGLHVGVPVAKGALQIGKRAAGEALQSVGLGDWRTARAPVDAPIPRFMERAPMATREAALRTGVAQAVSGREFNIDPVISYASRQGFEEPLRASVGRAEQPRFAETANVADATAPQVTSSLAQRGAPLEYADVPALGMHPERMMKRYPVLSLLKERGGVAPSSPLAGELRSMGVSNKTVPGLFREGGRGAADNLVASEHARLFPGPYADEWNGYVPESDILEAVSEEISGAPRRTPEQAAAISDYRQRAQTHETRHQIEQAISDMGIQADPDIRARAFRLLDGNPHFDVEDALERAIIQSADELIHVDDQHAILADIPFDTGSDQALSERGRAAGGVGAEPGTTSGIAASSSASIGARQVQNRSVPVPQIRSLRDTAQASFAPEQMRLHDGEAVRIADERIAAAPSDDTMHDVTLQQAMEDVLRLADSLGDSDIVGRELADATALADTAEAYGRGVKAVADCRLRRS